MCGMLWYNEPGTEDIMTSLNGNIFRVTGPLCEEFTGPGEFPTQRPVTRSFDVFYDQRLNKRLSKQPWGWWFESSWRQCYGYRSKPRSPLTVTAMCWPYVYTDWVNPLPAEGLVVRWPEQGTPQNFGETILLHFLIYMIVLIKNQEGVEV